MMLRLIKYLHDFIARTSVPLAGIAIVVFGLIVFEGMVLYNQRSAFCQSCHVNRGSYRNLNLASAAHRPYVDGQKTCLDCHSDKDFHAYVKEIAVAGMIGFETMTNPQQREGFHVRDMPDDKCLACHTGMLEKSDTDPYDVSPTLATIGLRFDHKKHFDMKEYSPKQALRRQALLDQGTLSDDEKTELDFLQKVRLGACGQCHEKNQVIDPKTGMRAVDRKIQYYASNPIRCAGCHVDTVTSVHPGPPLSSPIGLPSEQTCRRCHNDRVHGRIVTFAAKCDSTEKPFTDYCIKCHPAITPGIHKSGDTKNVAGQAH